MRSFLFAIIVIFCNHLFAQTPFELNTLIESKSSVEHITPLGENFLVQLRGGHPLYNSYHYQCLNTSGELVWELNDGFTYMQHTQACVRDDGSVVIFNFDNGCDYISSAFEVLIVNAQGDIINQWVFSDIDNSPLVAEYTLMTALANQNTLAIGSQQGLQLFDLNTGTLGPIIPVDSDVMPLEIVVMDQEQLVFYNGLKAVIINWMSSATTSFDFVQPTQKLSLHGEAFYAIENMAIRKYSLDGVVLETYTLNEGTFIAHSTWNSNVLMAIVSHPTAWEEAKIFSETLSELGSFEIVDSHLFDISTFENAGDQYWLGGTNRTLDNSGWRAVVKSYPFFSEPFITQQDIGVTDVQFSNLHFIATQGAAPPNILYALVGDIEVSVTNFSENTVQDWSVHYNLPIFFPPPFCSSAVDFRTSTTAIEVGQTSSITMLNVPLTYAYNLEDQEVTNFSYCISSLGPNNFLDDYPDNDSFCIESSAIYTGVKEMDALGFSYLIQEESIQLTCNDAIQYVLVDMQGRVIDLGKKSKGTNTISTQALSSGIYAITLWNQQFSKTIRFSK
ncbi:MAG: hypothetical protein RLZZ77_386 [Bacteroidota bacterium]